MGNCCPKASSEEQVVFTSTGNRVQAFQGQGHRLGTGDEARYSDTANVTSAAAARQKEDDASPAIVDPNLTEEERAKIRADRAAAAEARLKKQGGGPAKKKKAPSGDAPLVGPNSKPTMQWTL